jgi:hypothetical protein
MIRLKHGVEDPYVHSRFVEGIHGLQAPAD